MLGGLGLFLFGMTQVETALKAIGGRSLARFLQRRTDTPLKAVGGGIVATALLQSSSVVSLMVLAFAGAGLLSLASAIGVVFGANLGTTFTGWVVATLGFKVDLEELVLPLLAAGGLLFVFGRDRTTQIGQVVIGLGLLLLGLEFMKGSVSSLTQDVDIERLGELAAWQYLLFGVVFAGVIQSSSAVMMVTLTALHADVISLASAAAIAIGADLGTTTTVLLGALKGSPSKRRVATAHVLFNVTTDAIAFGLRLPLLALVEGVGITDPLYSLVAFHSVFNVIGLLLFVPIIKPFASWLGRRFQVASPAEAHYLPDVGAEVADVALRAIEEETAHLIARVVAQNRLVFSPPLPMPPGRLPVETSDEARDEPERFEAMYDRTKRLEGEILRFATRLQRQPLEEAESRRLSQLLAAVRDSVHSTKQLKDIRHNLQAFEESSGPRINAYLDHFRSVMGSFTSELYSLRRAGQPHPAPEDIVEIIQGVHERHDEMPRRSSRASPAVPFRRPTLPRSST